jgi:F-type H+-transporting ATPase subunit b
MIVLGLNLTDLIAHLANLIVLIFILRLLLYKPISKFLHDREAKLKQAQDKTMIDREAAQKALDEQQKKLADANAEASSLLHQAREQAVKLAQDIDTNAKRDAEALTLKVQHDLENEVRIAKENMQTEMVTTAVEIAGRILKKDITPADNQQIIDDVLNKAG